MKRTRTFHSPAISRTRWLAYATTAAASADTAQAEIHYSGYIHDAFDGSPGAS